MKRHGIAELAAALGLRHEGDGALRVGAPAEPASAGPGNLAVALAPRYAEALAQGQARAALLWEGADWRALGLEAAIFAPRPRLAMAALTAHYAGEGRTGEGAGALIHETAVIEPGAELGPGARVGPFAHVGAGARIGPDARIGPHVSIASGVRIGPGCILEAGVRIGPNVVIGARFHAHPGVVIGADGFSFVTEEPSAAEVARESLGRAEAERPVQPWRKIHSLGGVHLGDDVEIGANSSVDAGTIRPTRIGDGSKLDALVQVGHNVIVGRHCLLCAHVAVGGSAVLGDGVVLGGQAGVADNIRIGDGVIAGGASKILSSVPAGRAVLGYPAMKMEAHVASYRALRRLPRLLARLGGLAGAGRGGGGEGVGDGGSGGGNGGAEEENRAGAAGNPLPESAEGGNES